MSARGFFIKSEKYPDFIFLVKKKENARKGGLFPSNFESWTIWKHIKLFVSRKWKGRFPDSTGFICHPGLDKMCLKQLEQLEYYLVKTLLKPEGVGQLDSLNKYFSYCNFQHKA